MGFRGMVALLGGLGQGYNEGKQQQVENDRMQAQLQLQQLRDAREQAAFDRTQQEQSAVAGAAQAPAPTVDQQGQQMPATMDNADIGQPGEPTLQPTTYKAGGQTGLTAAQGVDASRATDTPEAQSARISSALAAYDPARAAQLRASMLTEKNAQMDLANKTFDSGLNAAAAKGWDSLMAYTDESAASPAKHKFVPDADGKTGQVFEQLPDGTMRPTGQTFENSTKGAMTAAEMLSKTTPIAAKVAHYMSEQEATRKEAHDAADDRYKVRMAGVAETNATSEGQYRNTMGAAASKNADTNENYRQDMAKAALEKGDAALLKANGGTAAKMSPDDKAEFDDLKAKSGKLGEALTKAQLDASTNGQPFDPKNPAIAPLFEQKAVMERRMQQLFSKYREGSTPLADPMGIRQNNPGNLKPGGRFAQYSTPEEGLQALDTNLKSYADKGDDTIQKVITRWAPPSDKNNTSAYVKAVAQRSGIKPDQKINLKDPYTRQLIGSAILVHENGLPAITRSADKRAPSAAPVAAPSAAPMAAAAAAPGGADSPATGAAPAGTPGLMSRISNGISNFATQAPANLSGPAIQQRVLEAAKGGPPLTPQELQAAKSFGLAL